MNPNIINIRKLVLYSLTILLGINTVYGKEVLKNTAQKVAQNWYNHYAPSYKKQANISKVLEYKESNRTSFYIYSFDKGGFVMVSANDQVTPILGYGFEHDVSEEIINDAAKAWLNNYARQIDSVFVQDIKNEQMAVKWQDILENKFPNKSGKSVEPLMTTIWGQEWPYNTMCPMIPPETGPNALVGAVGVAIGQIMKYWNYPDAGIGYNEYIGKFNPQTGVISAFFNEENYNWQNMPDEENAINNDLATLLFHCGAASNMDYSIEEGSRAYASDALNGLKRHFDYSDSMLLLYRSNIPLKWSDTLLNELNNSRPILYVGFDEGNYVHAFVCDGYDNDHFFHMNWGWAGYLNGYFIIDELNPGGYPLNDLQRIVINIEPKHSPLIAEFEAIPDSSFRYQFINYSTGNPSSWFWDFGDGDLSYIQNPLHSFDTIGIYPVKLKVCFGDICDSITKMFEVTNKYFFSTDDIIGGIDGSDAAWFDYDNDNDLDLLTTGYPLGTIIYINDNGSTSPLETDIPFANLGNRFDINDIENDGDLDILFTGIREDEEGIPATDLYIYDQGEFILVNDSLPDVSDNASIGDFNNDGKNDVFLNGWNGGEDGTWPNYYEIFTRSISANLGNIQFGSPVNLAIPIVINGNGEMSSSWCDIDGDRDIDLSVSGYYNNESNTYILENIGDSLVLFNNSPMINVSGVSEFGDFNSDSKPDLIIGSNLYRNDGDGYFTLVSDEVMLNSNADYTSLGDADNDGDLDILIGTKLFLNEGNFNFLLYDEEFCGLRTIFGDYDGDGDLDIFSWGHDINTLFVAKIYENSSHNINNPPSAPSNLTSNMTSTGAIEFNWDKAYDDRTSQNELTYNLYIGDSSGSCNILSPLSEISSGNRRVSKRGNTDYNNSWVIKNLPDGVYYWSVQAIDNSFAGGLFAPEQTFVVCEKPDDAEEITGINQVCQGYTNINYTIEEIPGATTYFWTLPNGAIGESSSNSIFVEFDESATSGIISVRGINSCGEGEVSALEITVNGNPSYAGEITGESLVCQASTKTYIVNNISGISYYWSPPNDWIILSGQGTNSVTFTVGSSSGNITVTPSNSCGNGSQSIKNIEVINEPTETPSQGIGPENVNLYNTISSAYTTTSVNSTDYYLWELQPTNAGGLSSENDTLVSVTWDPGFIGNCSLKVKAVNSCGESQYSQPIIINVDYIIAAAILKNSNLKILPNPSNGAFRVTSETPMTTLLIKDMSGRTYYKIQVGGLKTVDIITDGIAHGLYLLDVQHSKGIERVKIVIR